MAKKSPNQLELPILVEIKRRNGNASPKLVQQQELNFFHKPASDEDKKIYKSISDNYFKSLNKC